MHDIDRIEAVRRFNRFYTRRIGVLNEGLLDSEFSLTECRILWELAHLEAGEGLTATELGRLLDLDGGYLSRLLRDLKSRDLVRAARSELDARQSLLTLSPSGRKALKPLEKRSQEQVAELLGPLSEGHRGELMQALRRVHELLDAAPDREAAKRALVLRPHGPGDMGWVIARHGALYAKEYGFDLSFEALVARIAADFIERFDSRREACWIAERDGVNVGSVCLVQAREEQNEAPIPGVAQLRLLLVDPAARGLGLGDRLVAECHRFAREAGYQRVRLWTNSQLDAAKHIYRKAGYQLIATEPFQGFGRVDLIGETWELAL